MFDGLFARKKNKYSLIFTVLDFTSFSLILHGFAF